VYRQFNIQQFYVLPTQPYLRVFLWISEQTAIISLYSINWLVFITKTQCVYCVVRTGALCTVEAYFVLRSPVPCLHFPTNAPHLSLSIFCCYQIQRGVKSLVFPHLSVPWEIRKSLPFSFFEPSFLQSMKTAVLSVISVQLAVSFHLTHKPLCLSTRDFCEILSVVWRIIIVCRVIQRGEFVRDLVRIIAKLCRHMAIQLHEMAV